MAFLMSLVALSIDSMLPALSVIGESFQVKNVNSTQLIVLIFFIGTGFGQLFFGPLSDSIGRKPAIYAGVSIFVVGCLISAFAPTFYILLGGRLLQGLGVSTARVVTQAIIRDQHQGRSMARVMSFITTIFILVPAIAPALGQGIVYFFNWQAIFLFLIFIASIGMFWLFKRLPETLPVERRLPFTGAQYFYGISEILREPISWGYTLASSFIFSALIAYLTMAQQIFQFLYQRGTQFPLFFGSLALTIGLSSLFNAKLVMIHGMVVLSQRALFIFTVLSGCFFIVTQIYPQPPLWALMLFLGPAFFCIGMLFGNFNALAMEPLGHIAGIGSAMMGSIQMLLSVLIGGLIGQSYHGTLVPLAAGFMILGALALLSIKIATQISKKIRVET